MPRVEVLVGLLDQSEESPATPTASTSNRFALWSFFLGLAAAAVFGLMYLFGGPREETSYFPAYAVGIPLALSLPFILTLNSFAKQNAEVPATSAADEILRTVAFSPTSRLQANVQEGFVVTTRSLLVDENGKRLCIIEDLKTPNPRLLNYRDVISSEVVEDGSSILVTKASRTSQMGSALVGGVLFGGVGAVVGALSGKSVSTSADQVERLELRILLNRPSDPQVTVGFLGVRSAKTSARYQEARRQADLWHATLTAVIRQADTEAPVVSQPVPAASVTDELRKLAELKSGGVLTEDEFLAEKRRILARE
jgi:hypothetical protein